MKWFGGEVSAAIIGTILMLFGATGANGQWVQEGGGPSMGSVSAIAVAGNRIIAGSGYGDIFVSSDNGVSWKGPRTLTSNSFIYQIVVGPTAGPSSDTAIFAAAFTDSSTGVFMSTDGGNMWSPDGELPYVECIAVSGVNLFAGTWSHGIYYSSNSGQSWSAVDKGLPTSNGSAVTSVTALAVNPSVGGGGAVYAATYGGGIFETTNNGSSWNSIGLANSYVNALALGTSGGGGTTIFAATTEGLYSTTNNGTNWARVDSSILHFPLTSIALSDSAIVVGSDSGLYVSTDDGNSWSQPNLGVSSPGILATAANGSMVFVGTDGGGIFLSRNNGSSWIPMNTDVSTFTVASFLSENGNLFIGTNNGVYLSGSDGVSWIPASVGLSSGTVTSLVSAGSSLFAGTGSGVFTSTDNGTSWSPADSGLGNRNITAMLVVPSGDSTAGIYAGTPNGVFISTDIGLTWARNDSDLTDTGVTSFAAVQLPGTSYPYVYIGTKSGSFYTSGDFGIWNAQSFGLSSNQITALIGIDTNIFAGTSGGGIFTTSSYGGAWGPSDSGLTNQAVTSLASTPPLGQSGTVGIFAGTSTGIFMSTNNGVSWSDIGMDNYPIKSLAVVDSFLLAGTVGYGVWREPLSAVLTGIISPREEIPTVFKLFQNYPNPFNPTTAISYQLSAVSNVSLKVYDVLGREVETLVHERQSPGNHVVKFDGSRLASGVYFYRLDTGNMVQVKKMMLVK